MWCKTTADKPNCTDTQNNHKDVGNSSNKDVHFYDKNIQNDCRETHTFRKMNKTAELNQKGKLLPHAIFTLLRYAS